jgi:AraC-like DNA-binding protein
MTGKTEISSAGKFPEVKKAMASRNNSFLTKRGHLLTGRKKRELVNKMKKILGSLVHYSDEQLMKEGREIMTRELKTEYTLLSEIFSEIQNTNVENYFTGCKIERAKELLVYYDLSPLEVSYQLNYQSIDHLSGQFEEITGTSPSNFKNNTPLEAFNIVKNSK